MLRLSAIMLVLATCWALGQDTKPNPLPKDTMPPISLKERPRWLPALKDDKEITEQRMLLGRRLFFDPILSANGSVACASCHQPEFGFSTSTRLADGIDGKQGHRHPPTLLNRGIGSVFFWDGRSPTLEDQALKPIESPHEMGSSVADAVSRLKNHAEYPKLFREAFADGLSQANLAKALAAFERQLFTGDTRVDRFRAGDLTALNTEELHGLWLYESRGQCWRCHSGRNFSDESLHNTGVSWGKQPVDLGRYEHTKADADRGKFKTPTLRGLTRTAPYMHDGSLATLENVVEYYNRGGEKNPNLDRAMQPLGLSKQDMADLVAFLRALSDEKKR